MATPDLLAAARGDRPADVIVTGARVANVFTAEWEAVDVAVSDGVVVGMGEGYEGQVVLDRAGAFLLPGFLDAHVHIESSLSTPAEFARAVVPRGTTTVVCDPHEIANVHGLEGIRWMLEASEGLPLQVLVMASSCVPATDMGTAGAALEADDLRGLLAHPRVLGLAEVMNFPGVIHGDPGVLAKLEAFRRPRPVDGHAPGVGGRALNAYALAGPGSDHECTTPEEARREAAAGAGGPPPGGDQRPQPPRPPPRADPGQPAAGVPVHRRPPAARPPGRGGHRRHAAGGGVHGHGSPGGAPPRHPEPLRVAWVCGTGAP